MLLSQHGAPSTRPPSLRRRLLQGLALSLYRHPFWALLFLITVSVLAAWYASRLEISADLRVLVPLTQKEQQEKQIYNALAPSNAPVTAVINLRASTTPNADGNGLLSSTSLEATQRHVAEVLREAWNDPSFTSDVMYVEAKETDATLSLAGLAAAIRPRDLQMLAQVSNPRYLQSVLEDRLKQEEKSGRVLVSPNDPLGLCQDLFQRADPVQSLLPATISRPYVDPEGKELVFIIQPIRPASEFFYSMALYKFLDTTVDAINARKDPTLPHLSVRQFYGRHMDTAESAKKIFRDLIRITSVLVVCFVLLLLLAFRKFEALLFVLLPTVMGLAWAYGLIAWFAPQPTVLAAFFPLLLSVLGIEYSIQIYHRFVEELNREGRYYPALATAYSEAGRGVIVSSIATLLIFLSFHFSQLHHLRETALLAGVTVGCLTLATLLFLPPLAALKSILAGGEVQPLETWDFALSEFSVTVIASPRIMLGLGLLLTAYLGFYSREIEINRKFGLDLSAAETLVVRKSNDDSPVRDLVETPHAVLVEAATLEEALRLNDQVYKNLLAVSDKLQLGIIRSLSPFLPSQETQQEVREQLRKIDLNALDMSFRTVATKMGWRSTYFHPFLTTLTELRKTDRALPLITPQNLTTSLDASELRVAALTQAHVLRLPSTGRYAALTTVFPRKDPLTQDSLTQDEQHYETFKREVANGLPIEAVSFLSDIEKNAQVARQVLYTMALTVFITIFVLLVSLLPHFKRHTMHAMLALLPLFCAVVWTLGIYALLGMKIGLYALLGLPLLIGLSVNQSILFLQRFNERRYASLRQVMRSGGRPGLISGAFLVMVMASLAQVRFKPLGEIALALGIAIFVSTLVTLALLPGVLQIREEGGLSAWHEEEDE